MLLTVKFLPSDNVVNFVNVTLVFLGQKYPASNLNFSLTSNVHGSLRHVGDELQNQVFQGVHCLSVGIGIVTVPKELKTLIGPISQSHCHFWSWQWLTKLQSYKIKFEFLKPTTYQKLQNSEYYDTALFSYSSRWQFFMMFSFEKIVTNL